MPARADSPTVAPPREPLSSRTPRSLSAATTDARKAGVAGRPAHGSPRSFAAPTSRRHAFAALATFSPSGPPLACRFLRTIARLSSGQGTCAIASGPPAAWSTAHSGRSPRKASTRSSRRMRLRSWLSMNPAADRLLRAPAGGCLVGSAFGPPFLGPPAMNALNAPTRRVRAASALRRCAFDLPQASCLGSLIGLPSLGWGRFAARATFVRVVADLSPARRRRRASLEASAFVPTAVLPFGFSRPRPPTAVTPRLLARCCTERVRLLRDRSRQPFRTGTTGRVRVAPTALRPRWHVAGLRLTACDWGLRLISPHLWFPPPRLLQAPLREYPKSPTATLFEERLCRPQAFRGRRHTPMRKMARSEESSSSCG